MKKQICTLLLVPLIVGCTILRPYKQDIEQGNIFTEQEVNQLHTGMSEEQVKEKLGTPVLFNIFTKDRVDYVYTYQQGYGTLTEKKATLHFRQGRLDHIEKN